LEDGNSGMKRSKSGDCPIGVAKADADLEERALDIGDVYSIEEADADSLANQESEAYCNRIHCCLVVSPAEQATLYIWVSQMQSLLTSRFLKMGRYFTSISLRTRSCN